MTEETDNCSRCGEWVTSGRGKCDRCSRYHPYLDMHLLNPPPKGTTEIYRLRAEVEWQEQLQYAPTKDGRPASDPCVVSAAEYADLRAEVKRLRDMGDDLEVAVTYLRTRAEKLETALLLVRDEILHNADGLLDNGQVNHVLGVIDDHALQPPPNDKQNAPESVT